MNPSAFKDFCISVDEDEFGLSRDQLAYALAAENIETRSYYSPSFHLQTAYRHFASGHRKPCAGKFKFAEVGDGIRNFRESLQGNGGTSTRLRAS